MPPYPLWLRGVDAVRTFFGRPPPARPHASCPSPPTGRPGSPSTSRRARAARYEAFGIQVIEQSEGKIIGIHAFLDPRLFALFGVPLTLTR